MATRPSRRCRTPRRWVAPARANATANINLQGTPSRSTTPPQPLSSDTAEQRCRQLDQIVELAGGCSCVWTQTLSGDAFNLFNPDAFSTELLKARPPLRSCSGVSTVSPPVLFASIARRDGCRPLRARGGRRGRLRSRSSSARARPCTNGVLNSPTPALRRRRRRPTRTAISLLACPASPRRLRDGEGDFAGDAHAAPVCVHPHDRRQRLLAEGLPLPSARRRPRRTSSSRPAAPAGIGSTSPRASGSGQRRRAVGRLRPRRLQGHRPGVRVPAPADDRGRPEPSCRAEFAPSVFSPRSSGRSVFSPSCSAPTPTRPSVFCPCGLQPERLQPVGLQPVGLQSVRLLAVGLQPVVFSPSVFSPSCLQPLCLLSPRSSARASSARGYRAGVLERTDG